MPPKNRFQKEAAAKKRAEGVEPDLQQQVNAQITKWRMDPESFFEEALGIRLSNQQREFVLVFREMIQAKRKQSKLAGGGKLIKPMTDREVVLAKKLGISIHSGKGLGKDFTIAGLSLYFLLCYPSAVGLVTAPTSAQLEDIYSKEIKIHMKNGPAELWRLFDVTKRGIYLKDAGNKKSETFITKRTANIRGSTEEQGETLQGMHGDYMLLICDESSGLPDGVFRPLETTLTGMCNIAVLIGNVTRGTGYFYNTKYNSKDREHWEVLHWDAEESDLEDIKPGLKAQIDRMERKYGRDSNAFRINVQGLPPLADKDALIPLDWILSAVDREVTPDVFDPSVLTVDPGRGGDPSALLVRHGNKVIHLSEINVRDTMLVADWAEVKVDEYDPDSVGVDPIGIGAGVVDKMRLDGYIVTEVNAAERASRHMRFKNLRAELYWRLREDFENKRISIPDDEDLRFELASIKVKTWEPVIQIESKKEMLSRGIKSPNKADALMLSKFIRGESKAVQDKARDKYEEAWAKQGRQGSDDSWMLG